MTAPLHRAVVVGAGGHARVVLSVLSERDDYDVVGVVDTREPRPGEVILGVPVISAVDGLERLASEGVAHAFLALGENNLRSDAADRLGRLGFALPPLISDAAYVAPTAHLGPGILVAPHAHVGPEAVVGAGVIVNTQANVEHEVSVGDYAHLAPGSSVGGRSRLGARVLLGMGARVIEKVRVADGVVIGANAVVIHDVDDDGARLVGVPARSIGVS